jgi:hypothetical protein
MKEKLGGQANRELAKEESSIRSNKGLNLAMVSTFPQQQIHEQLWDNC